MGILEDIQENIGLLQQKQDMLMSAIKQLAAGKPIEFGNAVSAEPPALSVVKTEETAASIGEVVMGKGDLDLNTPDATGVAWDDRIHSSNQKQTAKNVWSKRKGVTPADFNRIHAELLAQSTIAPPPPAETIAPPPPAAPSVSNAPIEISANEQNKKDLLEQMNVLTSKYEMEFDVVLTLLKKFNANTLDTLDPANFPAATTDFKAWHQWLEMISIEVDKINIAAAGNPAAAENIAVIFNNGNATSLNTIQFDKCGEIHDQMKAYREQWDAFAAGQ